MMVRDLVKKKKRPQKTKQQQIPFGQSERLSKIVADGWMDI
jgi:hypothetical protein